eukprot:EG_transcript_8634
MSTIAGLSSSLQGQLITDTLTAFEARLQAANDTVRAYLLFLAAKRLGQRDLSPAPDWGNASVLPTVSSTILADFGRFALATMRAQPYFSFLDLEWGVGFSDPTKYRPTAGWMLFQAWDFNLVDNSPGRSVSLSLLATNAANSRSVLAGYYPDQSTLTPLVQLLLEAFPASPFTKRREVRERWTTDLVFNEFSGKAELYYDTRSYPALNDTYYDVTLAFDSQTISQDLKSKVANNSRDRLFILFRQPHGHMLGASHGKFYSLSDVTDNPLTHPPNASLYWAYTCFDSNDAIIAAVCAPLYALAGGNWSNVPVLSTELTLLGDVYWVSTGLSSLGLHCTMVALKYKAAVMGPVDAMVATATEEIDQKKLWTYTVLGATVSVAVLVPLLIGWWLAVRLGQLGARLRNAEKLGLPARAGGFSVVAELHSIQDACQHLEQGLARLLPPTAGPPDPGTDWLEAGPPGGGDGPDAAQHEL